MKDFIDIITAPGALFKRLQQNPTFWLPMLLFVLGTASAQLGYFLHNDAGFVRSEIIEQSLANAQLTKEQRTQMENNLSKMNISTVASVQTAIVVIFIPVILALDALYLGFVSRFSFIELGFKHWISLVSWSSVPALFAVLAAWLVLLTDSSGQTGMLEMQPLSIAGLLGLHVKNTTIQGINLATFWSLGLGAIGYQQWTKSSWLKSILLYSAPSVVIYGAIIYFTL
jgi:hypothetical protein